MPPTNLIVNGTFDQGSTHWSGTDMETNPEHAYLGNGSTNRVAELDGHSGQTTVMEQDFSVDDVHIGELTLDVALRSLSQNQAGEEGFTVEIVDSAGAVMATTTVLPTSTSYVSVTLPVTFPAAGDYTLRFTELGPDNSLGAIIDNVALMVCFAGWTAIQTPKGPVCASDLRPGDLVTTQTGPKPLRWIGRRTLGPDALRRNAALRPVRIVPGALGHGLPRRTLWVSRQHRMLVTAPVVARMLDVPEVLMPALRLTDLPGIAIDHALCEIEYVHLLFDDHVVLSAEGAPAESLLRAPLSDQALQDHALIADTGPGAILHDAPAATIPPPQLQTGIIRRLSRNGKPILRAASPTSQHMVPMLC